jgi:hypothetical protein
VQKASLLWFGLTDPLACLPACGGVLLQDDRIVFLSNVWLDRTDTFEALHTLLSGELVH